ncbi:hypothetical protein [Paraburkholderia sp.]|uniref:hypothetical protein n=1 Tax=Paraburkholderia sp. TaxID=1926495 RepID=UPI002D4592D4|nr:hypothetical protein [Paraburkholderia sp.]HZZ02964.1 hypothetical protein [Paraburkholderia sp.]
MEHRRRDVALAPLAVIALAATGVLSAVWVALLHNLGTFIVIANAGRLLRMDEGGQPPQPARNAAGIP